MLCRILGFLLFLSSIAVLPLGPWGCDQSLGDADDSGIPGKPTNSVVALSTGTTIATTPRLKVLVRTGPPTLKGNLTQDGISISDPLLESAFDQVVEEVRNGK